MVKEIRGQFFVWFGILGGALTIVNHWSNFITLADWMHWLVEHFSTVMYRLWIYAASILSLEITREEAYLLSALLFYVCLTTGTVIMAGGARGGTNQFLFFIVILLLTLLIAMFVEYKSVTILLIFLFSMGIAEGNSVQRLFVAILLMSLYTINFPSHNESNRIFFSFIYTLSFIAPLYYTKTAALTKRLIFLFIGVAVIFSLSEVSKQVERFRTATATLEAQPKP